SYASCPLSCFKLVREREVDAVLALRTIGVLAAVFAPVDVERGAQHPRFDERAHVEPHAIVHIRLPSNRLLVLVFPPYVDVIWRLAIEDRLQLPLQHQRSRESSLCTGDFVAHLRTLTLHPVLAEIGVGQLL